MAGPSDDRVLERSLRRIWRPVGLMAGVSVASWLAVTAIVGWRTGVEILYGMLGPLVVASAAWVLMVRTHEEQPGRLTAVMVGAFAGKMAFFGVYVAVVLKAFSVRPVPFVISFTSYFITLHLMEALSLRRLLDDGSRARGGAGR